MAARSFVRGAAARIEDFQGPPGFTFEDPASNLSVTYETVKSWHRTRVDEYRQLCSGIALVDLDLGLVQFGVEVAGLGLGVFPGILGHIEDFMFAIAICWDKMPTDSSRSPRSSISRIRLETVSDVVQPDLRFGLIVGPPLWEPEGRMVALPVEPGTSMRLVPSPAASCLVAEAPKVRPRSFSFQALATLSPSRTPV